MAPPFTMSSSLDGLDKGLTAGTNLSTLIPLKKDHAQQTKSDDSTGMSSATVTVLPQANLYPADHAADTNQSATDHLQLDVRDPQALSQFGKLISVKANASHSQLQVQVVPQGMGQLNVTVTNSSGGVQVHVMANEASTFAWLNQQMPQLQASMQAAGLNISGFQLSYGRDGAGSNGESKQDKPSSSRRIASITGPSSTDSGESLVSSGSIVKHRGDISVSV